MMMNTLDSDYLQLMKRVEMYGRQKEGRNGVVTSIFGEQISHDMRTGFPILTTKKVSFSNVLSEFIWMFSGDTNVEFLQKRGCKIWNGNWEDWKIYNPDATNMGKIYGYQYRNFKGRIDQIRQVYEELLNNPYSRRIMVTAWNPADLDDMALPPCHYGFQFYVEPMNEGDDKKYGLSLLWNQRSVDVPLGLPYNITFYGLMLTVFSKLLDMTPMKLVGNLGDVHIYNNQWEGVHQQHKKSSHPLPTIYVPDALSNDIIYTSKENIQSSLLNEIRLVNYTSEPPIHFPFST